MVAPLVILAGLLLTVLWVYQDAARHAEADEPVVFWAGSVRLDTPSAWAAACLVLWVACFPLYLRARQRDL